MVKKARLPAPPCAPGGHRPDRLVAILSRSWLTLASAICLALSGAGCSTTGQSDAAIDAGNQDDAPISNLVWPGNATKMVAEDRGGGFTGPAPAGSACAALRMGTYTLTVADQRLAWHVCTAGSTYSYVDGTRTLDDTEYASLIAALRATTLSTRTTCGADKSMQTLTVTTPSGATVYLDSFYVCSHQGTYIDGIDGVFAAASTLAHQ